MKIVFINPNSVPALNTGLTYVMSAVEKENEIKLLDLGLHGKRYQGLVREHLKKGVDVVAFSAFTHNFKKALEIANFIKHNTPFIKIIFGGIHPSLLPEEVISCPEVDAICIGEGEDAFREYLDKLERKEEPFVSGIWFKDRKGKIIRNPLRSFKKDIDSLEFPNWDHWDMQYYIDRIQMERIGFISSRGCPFNCTFCSNPALREAIPGDFVRTRDPEQVILEIKSILHKYHRLGFKYVRFDDEVFGLDSKFLKRFCSLYIKEGLSKELAWSCQTRADLLTDEYVDLIAEAGCAIVGLGVETGDDFVRHRLYKKSISNDAIIKAVARLKKRNISYLFYMIYNAPHTDRSERIKTKRLVKALNPLRATFSPFMYLPKTELGDDCNIGAVEKMPDRQRISMDIYSDTNIFLSLIFLFHRLWNSFRSGLRLKGFRFILDSVKFICIYLFQYRGKSFSLSGLEIALFQLEYFTLFKYAIYDSRKNLK